MLFHFFMNNPLSGLGDIVMPGLLLCFVLRYDAYKKSQGLTGSRLTYFHCSLLGYFLGLLTATVSSEVFKAAQPALLYLVPFTLLPLLTMAYLKVFVISFVFPKLTEWKCVCKHTYSDCNRETIKVFIKLIDSSFKKYSRGDRNDSWSWIQMIIINEIKRVNNFDRIFKNFT